jgi:hypothetical protein
VDLREHAVIHLADFLHMVADPVALPSLER